MERKLISRQGRKVCAIVGDGFIEKIYFENLKSFERRANIQVKPELPDKHGKGGAYVRVLKKALKLKLEEEYDVVYCLIDFDVIISENKLESYFKFKNSCEKKGVVVLEMNPCFEIWFLLHFERTASSLNNCDAVAKILRKNNGMEDYSKSQKYHRKKDFYSFLYDKIKDTDGFP